MTAPVAESISPRTPDPWEDMIHRRARHFDIPSLILALERMGYSLDDLQFRGNPEPNPPRGIVEAVRFERAPRRAIITLNIGLNGHRGLLPAYFEEFAEGLAEPETLHKFIAFFEDGLLRDYAKATTPEIHPRYFALTRAQFSMLGLHSVSTLSWLFETVFPELAVRGRRAGLNRKTDAHALSVGGPHRLDGSSVLGASHDAGHGGFRIGLLTIDEFAPNGRSWWSVAIARLRRRILPVLARAGVLIEVVLIVADHASWAQVGADGQLGYDRLMGTEGEHRVLLFRDGAFRAENLIPPTTDRWTPCKPWNPLSASLD